MKNEEEIIFVKEEKPDGCYVRQRYLLAVMAFLGLCNVSFLRNQVYVTILAMLNNTHENGTHIGHMGAMNWSSTEEGLFLGAYFYGYVLGNLPGGWLVTRYGFRNTFPVAVFISAVINLFTPWAAYTSVYLATVVRSAIGLIQGVASPAVNAIWSYWAPPAERSILMSISISGFVFGYIIINPTAGYIAQLLSWEAVYYFTGGLAIVWSVLFYTLFTETPSKNSRISFHEKKYIENSLGKLASRPVRKKSPIPWKSIMTSKTVLAIYSAHLYDAWFQCALAAVLPTFFVNILNFNMTQSGLVLMIPFIFQWIFSIIGGKVTDRLRKRGCASTTFMRKFNTCIALFFSSWLIALNGYLDNNCTFIVATICLSFALTGLTYPGFLSNPLDIAPNYAGLIAATSNTLACTSGFLGPLTAGYIITNKSDIMQWRIFFWITCVLGNISTVAYAVLASGVEQEWAKAKEKNVVDTKQQAIEMSNIDEKSQLDSSIT